MTATVFKDLRASGAGSVSANKLQAAVDEIVATRKRVTASELKAANQSWPRDDIQSKSPADAKL